MSWNEMEMLVLGSNRLEMKADGTVVYHKMESQSLGNNKSMDFYCVIRELFYFMGF